MARQPGKLFVIDGDLLKVKCDAVLIPTDENLVIEPTWADFLGVEPGPLPDHPKFTPGRRVRKFRSPSRRDALEPSIWLGDFGRVAPEAGWYARGLEVFVRDAARSLGAARLAVPPRLAVNLVGAGAGGSQHDKGALFDEIVPALHRAAEQHSADVILVCWGERPYSAAQRSRQDPGIEPPAAEPEQVRTHIARLAAEAQARNLVLFIGAGVSMGAGLMSWDGLIERLREDSGSNDIDVERFNKLDVRDQAAILAGRFDSKREYRSAIAGLVGEHERYSLAHGLLSSLHTRENVTTNYDRLFETAVRTGGRRCSVLPHEPVRGDHPWLLKLHGSLDRPGDLVLTRSEYLGLPERSGALFGILQAMLMTRHMLFVGYSLTDDSFHRVMHEVRKARPRRRSEKIGTALMLEHDPLVEELWGDDLHIVTMDWRDAPGRVSATAGPGISELTRRLDHVLDRICVESADVSSFLLDDTYSTMLRSDEEDVQRLLSEALGVAKGSKSPTLEHVADLLRTLGG